MGNPTSASKVQTTMSLPKGRHRQSLSVGASLEKLAPHEKLRSSAEEKLASGTTVSPRTTEEESIAAFLGDKKMKRRTRSSLGGSEEFIKGFELNGVATAAEDRKPLSSIPFRGQRRAMSGNVTPRAADSPRAKVMCIPQGAEKNGVAKSASSLFHSPTNLERSMSLSRLAHRTIPDADGSTPRCRTGVLREVILPGERGKLAELKRQDFQRGVESKLQAAHRNENGSGRRSSSVLLEKKLEGPGAPKTRKTAVLYAHDNDENLQCGASMVFSTDSWPNHEQMFRNPAYLPVKDIHPVCLETTTKLHSEQPMTSRSLDMGYDLHGFVRRSSVSTVTSSPLPCSSRGFNPSGPEDASNPTLKAADSLHLEPQRTNVLSTHVENSYRLNPCDVQSNLNSYPGGLETRSSIELQGQPFPITTPSRKQSLLHLTRQDLKNFHCHPLPLPPTSKTSQVKVKDRVGTHELKQKISVSCSSDKVSEEGLTEAAFLSSLVCEDHDPAGPVLISEEPKQFVMNATQVEEIVPIREKEVGLRNTSDPGACLRKSTSFEPGLEEKARIENEKKTKLRKRRRSVSASGIGAMLLKVVRVTDTGPLETRTVPIAELEISKVDLVESRDSCAQTCTVPSMGQSEPPTTSLNEDVKVETQTNNTEALDMDVEYQDCSVELVTSDSDACLKVNAEGTSANKDMKPLLEEGKELPLQIVGDTQESKIKSYAEGSQCDSVAQGSQVDYNKADSEFGITSWNSNNGQDKREISSIVNRTLVHSANKILSVITANDPNKELLKERILGDAGVLKGLGCDAHQRETSSTSVGFGSIGAHQELEKGTDRQQALVKNARLSANSSLVKKEEGPGGSRRKLRQGHQGRVNSYDLDSSTDCRLKKPGISEAANTETEEAQTTTDDHNNKGHQPLALLDENVTITRESTRPARSLIVSMLQVSPRQSLDDDYHLAPSSISILANPSFSSSHQDRIWEEQAEAYSSGGRGTPGREDDTATNVFLHSSSPGGAISSDDQIHSAAHGSLRRGQGDTSVRISATSGYLSDNGRGNGKRKSGQSKKRGRPRTPLRSLLAEDLHGKTTSSQGRSPESHGHFLQQLMSRIRGSSSSKSSSPTSQEQAAMPKTRRNTIWSSCWCFPH